METTTDYKPEKLIPPTEPLKLHISHQENYSRTELILRALFGWLYIGLPHGFLILFYSLWGSILTFIAFWTILFTGRYPESMFEFHVKLMRWQHRVNARMLHLCDDYPEFFLDGQDDKTDLKFEYPEKLNRAHLILKVFFGWLYCGLPHLFILFFRELWSMILAFIAFWVVLFTKRYPESMHEFNVGTLRWSLRVNTYLGLMTDQYPPFTGKEIDNKEELTKDDGRDL